MKAAINADVIQTITILVVTVAVCIQGTLSSGGPKNVYQLNRDNGKQSRDLFQFDHVNLLGNRMALRTCVCVCVCVCLVVGVVCECLRVRVLVLLTNDDY